MGAKQDYKTMMAELTQLLGEMQLDGTDVDEAIAKYERGQKLIQELRLYLDNAENAITKHKVE